MTNSDARTALEAYAKEPIGYVYSTETCAPLAFAALRAVLDVADMLDSKGHKAEAVIIRSAIKRELTK